MIVYLDSVNKIQRQFLEHELITVRRKRTLYDSSVKTYLGSDFASTKLSSNGPMPSELLWCRNDALLKQSSRQPGCIVSHLNWNKSSPYIPLTDTNNGWMMLLKYYSTYPISSSLWSGIVCTEKRLVSSAISLGWDGTRTSGKPTGERQKIIQNRPNEINR